MILTKDYQPYDGDYQKKMQDIKLKDGTEYMLCWPNAGKWHCSLPIAQIDDTQVAEIRLTNHPDF